MRRTLMLGLALMVFAAACGTDEDQEDGAAATTVPAGTDALTLDLREQNDSGITGTVSFRPTSDGLPGTPGHGLDLVPEEIEIELKGSDGGPHPAHIHPGSCADLDPAPKWPLNDVVDGKSNTTIDAGLAELTEQEYAVNVHDSPENADLYVACADIRFQ